MNGLIMSDSRGGCVRAQGTASNRTIVYKVAAMSEIPVTGRYTRKEIIVKDPWLRQ